MLWWNVIGKKLEHIETKTAHFHYKFFLLHMKMSAVSSLIWSNLIDLNQVTPKEFRVFLVLKGISFCGDGNGRNSRLVQREGWPEMTSKLPSQAGIGSKWGCQYDTVDGKKIRLTSWYGEYSIVYKALYIPDGAGFLPSTEIMKRWNCGYVG